MAQFGSSTITNAIVPFLTDIVFGNVEKDKLLQKAVRFDETLTEFDKSSIISNYTLKTNSIIASDTKFNKIFWKEFFTWIDTQKQIAGGDPLLLSKRLLPVNPSGGYYDEAFRNFDKFGFQSIKAYEFFLINEQIEARYAKGSTEERNEKVKLKNGDLILLKTQNDTFSYFQKSEIRTALDSVKRSDDLYSKVKTIKEGASTYMISFNPLKSKVAEDGSEVKSTILDVNKELWSNKRYLVQAHLEQKIGLYVDGNLTVDEKGVVSGRVMDKNKTKLRIEVSVDKPTDKKLYKITFVDTPTRSFSVRGEDELYDHFVNKNRSAAEVFALKQKTEHKKVILPPGIVAARIQRVKQQAKGELEIKEKSKTSEPIKAQVDTAKEKAYAPPGLKSITSDTEKTVNPSQGGDQTELDLPYSGPMNSKQQFNTNLRNQKKEIKGARAKSKPAGGVGNNKRTGVGGSNKKNPVLQVMKYYGYGFGALGGGLIGTIFFT